MPIWLGLLRDITLGFMVVLLLWLPLGRWTIRLVRKEMLAPSLFLTIPLGMGVWGLWILGLGIVGILNNYLLFVPALLWLLGLKAAKSTKETTAKLLGSLSKVEWWCAGLMACLAFCYLCIVAGSAAAPEVSFDALNVHLPYARSAAESQRIEFSLNNWSSSMPALPLMSYISAFLLTGTGLAKIFNVSCYLACGGVAFYFSRRWFGLFHGCAAALLVWSCPVALYEATTTLIDLPFALFCGIAICSLLEWVRKENRTFLWLSAFSLGLAFGCKYLAALWVPPITLLIVLQLWRAKQRPLEILRVLLCYGAIVLALFAPWLLRTWLYTGNPVFPLANGLFNSPYFTPAMEAAAQAAYDNEGVGRSFVELIKLPWTVTFFPGAFRGTLGAVFLVGIVLALIRMRDRHVRLGLLATGLYFYAWALAAQEIRYLLPLVPLLAAIITPGFLGAAATVRPKPPGGINNSRIKVTMRYLGALTIILGSLVSLPALYPKLITEWTYWHSYKSPVPLLLGKQTPEAYLERDVPSIYVYQYINENLAADDRILLLNDASRFYSRIATLYSFTVEAEEILMEENENKVLAGLKSSGISHVLLNYHGIKPMPGVAPRKGVYFFLDKEFQDRHLRQVFAKNNVVLFQVKA